MTDQKHTKTTLKRLPKSDTKNKTMFKEIPAHLRRSQNVAFRLTENEYKALKEYANSKGLKPTVFIRDIVLNHLKDLGIDTDEPTTSDPNQLRIDD